MPTEIKQVRDDARGRTVLRVSGEMFRDDAELVGRIADEIAETVGDQVTLDLADLDLLDSEAAHILRELSEHHGHKIIGIDILVQHAIDTAERHA
ncbi:MAG: STAS domain-containing protein [Pyrinomonadaceae bacterium]